MEKEPKVLTRMRLSCCWGDTLNEKELNEVVDYINYLQRQNKKQQEIINRTIEYIKSNSDIYRTIMAMKWVSSNIIMLGMFQ